MKRYRRRLRSLRALYTPLICLRARACPRAGRGGPERRVRRGREAGRREATTTSSIVGFDDRSTGRAACPLLGEYTERRSIELLRNFEYGRVVAITPLLLLLDLANFSSNVAAHAHSFSSTFELLYTRGCRRPARARPRDRLSEVHNQFKVVSLSRRKKVSRDRAYL